MGVTEPQALEVRPGSPAPLGAHWDGTGTNFALWSAGAQAVDLSLFDPDGTEHRHRLEETTHQVWHGRVPGVGPGQRYGYRLHGPYEPAAGLRYNPAKLLLDPYTRAVDGDVTLHPALFGPLKPLGVTAVELLPVQHFVSEPHLLRRGLTNYWGYNTLGYFAPHAGYSASGSDGGQVTEFKTMVKELHAAGIEVLLDVVYNHTAEGDHTGPTLSFKGIDNPGYYRLDGGNRARYTDYTGCGNTLDVRRPAALGLLMDSLRYWVTEMHVDGFRFDLASALARSMHDVDRLSAFFDVVHQDPVVSS